MTENYAGGGIAVNKDGNLTIGGLDAVKLAEEFGTPLYVMDENKIRKNAGGLLRAMNKHFDGAGVSFASKAFLCLEMCRLCESEGLGLDVCSAGELHTALKADFPSEKITFHGNNKTPEELAYAVKSRIGRIAVDNIFELQTLNQIAKAANKRANILLRVKPGVEAHTHELIRTGGIDSKFGFALETGEALAAIREAAGMGNISLKGINCHIGSQIFDVEPFSLAAKIMLGLISEAEKTLGVKLPELVLGGGFAVKYLPGDDPAPFDEYIKSMAQTVKETCAELKIDTPFIGIEPGRSVVGEAGITLYKVGAVKEIPGIRTYVTVDGGMADNPRPGLYGAVYDMAIANKADKPRDKVYTVSGRCCETDQLREGILLQEADVGDILAVFSTGAYNYSMASNYNRLPKPAVVFIRDGAARTVVRRETLDDLVRNDV